jgi:predicted dinucleotide-binding enzyme
MGTGPVGQGIAILLERAGYSVTVGTRDPRSRKTAQLPKAIKVGTFAAAASADLVFLSVLHSASHDLVLSLVEALEGKVLVDTDNAWIRSHYIAAGLSDEITEGLWMSRLLPKTIIARALSHVNWDVLVSAATESPGYWATGYAIDDPSGHPEVEAVIRDMGYEPVLVGGLAESSELDVGGALWSRMFTPRAMRETLKLTVR